ncbi:MAG: prepilin-type N-terminal cleavage/methylation domain-containing protein [Elusimicrobiaceae bacterium]|nr:prepilin-type N-terminal cleavage/methylation domain-containing protein [Elusimicrobiaceae bacterium]
MKNVKGFTLIELLVVVFIIGILAAVSLPQYQRAVTKAKIAAMMPMLDAVIQGQQIYKTTWRHYAHFNTQYSDARIPLDIQVPIDRNKYVLVCNVKEYDDLDEEERGNTTQSAYKKGFCQLKLLVKQDGQTKLGPILEYSLPGMNGGLDYGGQSNAFSRMCLARKTSEDEQWACKSLTGASDHISQASSTHWYYRFQ